MKGREKTSSSLRRSSTPGILSTMTDILRRPTLSSASGGLSVGAQAIPNNLGDDKRYGKRPGGDLRSVLTSESVGARKGSSPPLPAPRSIRERRTSLPIITDERRDQLLEAARSQRIAWIEGTNASDDNWAIGKDGMSGKFPGLKDLLDFLQSLTTFAETNQNDVQHRRSSELRTTSEVDNQYLEGLADLSVISLERRMEEFNIQYKEFISFLKDPQSSSIVYELQRFVTSFGNVDDAETAAASFTAGSLGRTVHKFIKKLQKEIQERSLVAEVPSVLDEDTCYECLERFVMEKLYDQVFASRTADRVKDEVLHARIASLAFIKMTHLDISLEDERFFPYWSEAQTSLGKLAKFRSPRQKLDVIVHVCQVLSAMLKASQESNKLHGADEFLPALIYTVLRANPLNLHSELEYIAEFRRPSKMTAESGYLFTNLQSAISFLEHLDKSSLSIEPEEFEAGMRGNPPSESAETNPAPATPVMKVRHLQAKVSIRTFYESRRMRLYGQTPSGVVRSMHHVDPLYP